MIKILSILFISSFICSYSLCQSVAGGKTDVVKSRDIKNTGIKISGGNNPNSVIKDSSSRESILLDVLFATNEDCDLYISEEFKGTVNKSKHKYIKLSPGSYLYKARSKSTSDELAESFIVNVGDSNEIFIDLLYVVDEMNQQRESLKNINKVDSQILASNEKKIVNIKPEEKKIEINKETKTDPDRQVENRIADSKPKENKIEATKEKKIVPDKEEEKKIAVIIPEEKKIEPIKELEKKAVASKPAEKKIETNMKKKIEPDKEVEKKIAVITPEEKKIETNVEKKIEPIKEAENKIVVVKPEEKKLEPNKEAEKVFINALMSNMISIKEGSFIMGNNKAPSDDEAEHPVTIKPILFGKYEVTQQEWENVMGYNPSSNKDCSTCPVENVSWEETMNFIRKINEISDKKFRLPTESEWEYVTRLGGKSEIENAGGEEEYIKKTAWYYGNSNKKTHPVGQKQPNVAGIYDLLGNVSEWCADWYDGDYYKKEKNQNNPEGPVLGKEKVVRGGSYSDYTGDRFRPSLRNKLKPASKSTGIGFRLVMEVN